ncbi:MAG TPA: GH92 family glycosyl hydrolase [Bryobacteraceae bacterium]|nr:GH92 family glycosyl hydrolase [Bryobacteraceae bacterium]
MKTFAAFLICSLALAQAPSDPAAQVNPFIGTSASPVGEPGNTNPGATRPFGMLYWGPDQSKGRYYRFEGGATRGFSLTHLSGTGCPVFGDVPILPMLGTPVQQESYEASYNPDEQSAEPGFYAVKLASGIQVQLAAAVHSGIGELRYPAGGGAHSVLLDLSRNNTAVSGSEVHVTDRTITGWVSSGKFCNKRNEYRLYFVLEFDAAPAKTGTFETPRAAAYISFPEDATTVRMKVGLSYVSLANAQLNLKQEIPHWDFEKTRAEARTAWNKVLGLVEVKGGTEARRKVFYTALYHAFLHPSTFNDVNGEYLGFDDKVHQAKGRMQYANFSGWDIYRCQVQLIAVLMPKVASDMAQSLVADAEQGGGLPRWSVANNEAGSMVGDPADLIVANIYAFGGRDFDTASALKAMLHGATDPEARVRWSTVRPHGDEYLRQGFVQQDESNRLGSASITLEYTSADFAISQFAKALGDTASAQKYLAASGHWRKIFDPETKYIRPREADGKFLADFDPGKGVGFVEGNAAQYTWMIPYDFGAVIAAIGPDEANARLDNYFSKYGSYFGGPYFRISNEPSFACPWIYYWTGHPWRVQEVVRKTLTDLFTDTHGGLPGNDDLGAMSAWAVFAQLGIYPEIPAVGGFTLNSPTFPDVTLHLGSRNLHIQAEGAPDKLYIQRVALDGKAVNNWISWPDFSRAGSLVFTLAAVPDKAPGKQPPSFPPAD